MALAPLRRIRLVTPTREAMAVALPQLWRALRLMGYPRSTLIVAFARGWKAGDIRIGPA